jgi:hypothetical protein
MCGFMTVPSGGLVFMMHYEDIEMEVFFFDAEDIIVTSGGNGNSGSGRDEDEGEGVIPSQQP